MGWGRVKPIYLEAKPQWLSKEICNILAILDYGDTPFEIKSKEKQIYGVNFAFKKILFLKYGLFRVGLGPKARSLHGGEDTDIFNRFLDSGAKIVYQPNAIIHHKIPAARLKKSYFRNWHFYKGQSLAVGLPNGRWQLLGVPHWVIFEFFKAILFYPFYLICRNKEQEFRYQLKIIRHIGIFHGVLNGRQKA